MLTHALRRCVPIHTPGPTHRPRFDGRFVFHTMMTSSALKTVWVRGRARTESSMRSRIDTSAWAFMAASRIWRDSSKLACVAARSRQGQARRRRHWSSPWEDGGQSRTLAVEGKSLNDWTVDSWQHCIPQPDARAPQDCSVSASTERSKIFL